jgi:hypothetical protein
MDATDKALLCLLLLLLHRFVTRVEGKIGQTRPLDAAKETPHTQDVSASTQMLLTMAADAVKPIISQQ